VHSLLHLLHRASQRADLLFSHEVAGANITPRQYMVLQAVARNGGLSQTAIMAATAIDRSSVAELVGRLVRNGCLQRRRKRGDARANAIRLTPKGRQLLTVGAPVERAIEATLLARIPQAQRAAFLKVLKTVALSGE
jgi:DNA-binding MarR family transcriptional regulator